MIRTKKVHVKEFQGFGFKTSQGIDSYGVSMTTLEEIFLKLGEEEESKKEENELKVRVLYVVVDRL